VALRRNLAAALLEHGAIRTTAPKAKELRPFVEKIISTARKGTLHARRQVLAALGRDRDILDKEGMPTDQTVVQKLFADIAPRYADRPGGYTRIIRLAERRIGDAGSQVILQLVEETPAAGGEGARGSSRRRRRATRRHEAARAALRAAEAPEAAGTPAQEQEQPPADEQAEAADETPPHDQPGQAEEPAKKPE